MPSRWRSSPEIHHVGWLRGRRSEVSEGGPPEKKKEREREREGEEKGGKSQRM